MHVIVVRCLFVLGVVVVRFMVLLTCVRYGLFVVVVSVD